jgi:enoyl-CoA hydratase
MDFTSDVVTIERADHVATVWLDRPRERNAFGRALWNDLPQAIQAVSDDAVVRAVVIAAKGSAFTVGLDLKEFGSALLTGSLTEDTGSISEVTSAEGLYRSIRRMQQTMTTVAQCPKPVIAAIHGWCLGAGVDLITACDMRLAAHDAVFSIRETKLAMVADVGTLQRLPNIVAPGLVAELVYTGKDIDADRALAIGLVDSLHANREAVQKAALDLAREIAENSPLAVQGAKAVLRAGTDRPVEEALDYVALWNAAFLRSNDLSEAVRAFVEKRPPRFSGN